MFITLAAATLVSEDLTAILAGVLIQQGAVDPLAGIAACAFGIYVGDLLVYLAGRVGGRRALAWPAVQRYLSATRMTAFRTSLTRHAGPLIMASRFMPGTRLPVYLASGALDVPLSRFACWSLVAVVLWTPVIVLVSAQYGSLATPVAAAIAGHKWIARLVASAGFFLTWRLIARLITARGRQRLAASISRLWRWEFWPMWFFYAPVAAWIGWLVLRYRGTGAISAANPGMPDGGIVGESKHSILARLPEEWTIPSIRIEPGPIDRRVSRLVSDVDERTWAFPLVLKPDVGQRGTGVKIVRTLEDARDYVRREPGAILVQPYHPGPYEAGVFYYRQPGATHGRILSITDKHFPVVVGDGRSTIEELVWRHSRLRMQASTFLSRHAANVDRVLAEGERFRLAMAGNHAQGTLFRDGRHLLTPELEERIDRIARSYSGFFIGRFDIRYSDVDRFKAGEDLAIVELNGATAESTNIYDPSGSLLDAYRQLFRQWSLVFAIGAANRDHGAPVSSLGRLLQLLRTHLTTRSAFETSD